MKNKLALSKEQNRLLGLLRLPVLFLMLIEFNLVSAQSITSYENRLMVLKNSFNKESGILDSLKHILDERVSEIDYAKKKNADENNIKKIMAGTVIISDKIDEHQKRINIIEKELEDVKNFLSKKYTAEIDSLSALENSDQYEGNKSELKSRILTLTEKRILTAPRINSLSFNPEKMLEINLSSINSPAERKIYSEYLTGALAEVNNQLIKIKKINSEVRQMSTLQQKTKKFLEESEFDFDMKAANLASRSESSLSTNTPTLGATDKSNYQTSQVHSFFLLLKQLDLKQTTDFNTRSRFSQEAPDKQLTIKEYRELLKEVEKRLTDYRLILTHKISAIK